MKELVQALINQGIITASDVQRLSTLELLLVIIERVNELHGLTQQSIELVQDYLKTIQEQVIEQLNEWKEDGTLDDLINQSALKEINDRTSDFTHSYSMSKNKGKSWTWFGINQISFVGDSITHGANASDLDSESWAGIIKSSLLNKYGSKNQGFEKLYLSMSNTAQPKMDGFHVIENYGFDLVVDSTNLSQSKYVGQTGDSMIITPKASTKFQIIYNGMTADGTFTIKTNENYNYPITINSKVTSNEGMPYYATEFHVNKGDSIIIEVTNGTVELLGVLYYQDRSDLFVNNYGRSGAKLSEVSDEVLQMWSQSSLSFFALGHNDSFFPDTIETFREKITKMISYYKASKCYVVVLDFLWTLDKDNAFRVELQRMATELNAPYISFTEEIYGRAVASQQWIDDGFLSDASHPSIRGHQIIADVIAQRLSLGLKSFESSFNKIATIKNTSVKSTNAVIEQNHDVVSGFVEVVASRDSLATNNKLLTLMSGVPTKDITFYGFAVGKKSSKTVYEVIGFSMSPKGELYVWGADLFDESSDITLQVHIKYQL